VSRQPYSTRPAYLQSIRGLLRLHSMSENGRDDSPEAAAIRDALERPWYELSEAEKKRLTGLSEDLYSLGDPKSDPLPMNPQAQRKLVEALDARQSGDWDGALELLRHWGKYIDRAMLAWLRGTVWNAAGDSETAMPFYEHAAQLDPSNDRYTGMYLVALRNSQPELALARAHEIVSAIDDHRPLTLVQAASILVASTLDMAPLDARPIWQQSIRALETASGKLQSNEARELSAVESDQARIAPLLGFCYERIGDQHAALRCYMSFDPGNEALLIARGGLRYGVDPLASEDFEQAIRQGSSKVWPYFFLAHRNLVSNRFDECRRTCERALELPASDEVQANLREWLAISEAELGFPPERVRSAFEAAIRLAPDVERIRQNLEEFESAATEKPNRRRPWVTPTESTIQAVGKAGYSPIAAWPDAA
jgi:tetratricopeptide (TPR) repeat protein